MKKITTVLLIVFATTIMAQTKAVKPIQFGVKSGISFNHFLGDFPIDITPKLYIGFTAGVFGNYIINDKFSVQPEILYTRKGSKFKNNYADIADLYFKTDWIEIPILGMYQINDDFSLFCGPYLGFYLDGQAVVDFLGFLDIDIDIKREDLQLPDYGLVIGGLYNISKNIAVQARWEYGIQDLADGYKINILNIGDIDFIDLNNSSFQLQLDFTI